MSLILRIMEFFQLMGIGVAIGQYGIDLLNWWRGRHGPLGCDLP